MAKSIYVKDIKAGDKVSTAFLVAEKNMAYSQKGAPYLNLKLKDRTGEVDAKVWDNAPQWDPVFGKGDIVHCQARAVSYKNALQLSILEIRPLKAGDVDPADFFPCARRDPEAMFAELEGLVASVAAPHLKALLAAFFADAEVVKAFKRAPAAKGFHHVYIGGLLEHTLSVARLLDVASRHYEGVDRDLLLAGGILHDIGKIREYRYEGLIDYSDEGRLIGHIVIGVEMLDEKIAALGAFPPETAMALRHILLSHHGEMEFGSPKRPKTLEAMIVHQLDDLDAKVNAIQGFVADAPDDASAWTPFHRLFGRFLYKGKSG